MNNGPLIYIKFRMVSLQYQKIAGTDLKDAETYNTLWLDDVGKLCLLTSP